MSFRPFLIERADDGKPSFPCHYCPQKFKRNEHLQNHERKRHPEHPHAGQKHRGPYKRARNSPAKKSKLACENCVQRKVKCDQQRPTCGACRGKRVCHWEDETILRGTYDELIRFFFGEIYPLYPLFSEDIFAKLYQSAWQEGQEKNDRLWSMIDALCSLAAWYMDKPILSRSLLESARVRQGIGNTLEAFVTCTILVSDLQRFSLTAVTGNYGHS